MMWNNVNNFFSIMAYFTLPDSNTKFLFGLQTNSLHCTCHIARSRIQIAILTVKQSTTAMGLELGSESENGSVNVNKP